LHKAIGQSARAGHPRLLLLLLLRQTMLRVNKKRCCDTKKAAHTSH
jgi:hypothetical protein